jgi:hypothetical protein
VWVPSVTDDEGRRLLEEFARRSPRAPRPPAVVPRAARPVRAAGGKE